MGKNLFDLLKKDRPSIGIDVLGELGVPALSNAQDSDVSFREFLRRLMFSAGLNHIIQVNDSEDDGDYTESDNGVFDIQTAATVSKRVGTNTMKLTSAATCNGTQYVDTLFINESAKVPIDRTTGKRQMDWTDTDFLGFWVSNTANGDFSSAGELLVTIVNDGIEQTQVKVQALVDAVHQWFEVDMRAAGWQRDKVESLRFYANVATGEDIFIDDILRYLNSYNGAPLYGNSFPIKSSITLKDGDIVRWTVDGLIKASSAANIVDLGFVKIFEDEDSAGSGVTGDGARSKWGTVPNMCIAIVRANASTTAGDYLQWTADGKSGDVSTNVTEKGFAIALEAAGADGDDIFALIVKPGAVD